MAPACNFRLGEGCFAKLRFPEDLAAVPAAEQLEVRSSHSVPLSKYLTCQSTYAVRDRTDLPYRRCD